VSGREGIGLGLLEWVRVAVRPSAGTRVVRSSAESYDTRKAADLWETSVALTAASTQFDRA
jgi:hypothetical protein